MAENFGLLHLRCITKPKMTANRIDWEVSGLVVYHACVIDSAYNCYLALLHIASSRTLTIHLADIENMSNSNADGRHPVRIHNATKASE